jgi:hypothetical protein
MADTNNIVNGGASGGGGVAGMFGIQHYTIYYPLDTRQTNATLKQ